MRATILKPAQLKLLVAILGVTLPVIHTLSAQSSTNWREPETQNVRDVLAVSRDFEVASIRESKQQDVFHSSITFKGHLFIAEGEELRKIVQYAFGAQSYAINWAQFERYAARIYTVRASISEEQASYLGGMKDEEGTQFKRILVQNLLKSRFGLISHETTSNFPGYVLTVSKGGIKFQLTTAERYSDPREIKTPQISITQLGEMHAEKLSFEGFVRFLSKELSQPVVDKTGITAAATFDLKWAQDANTLLSQIPPGWANEMRDSTMTHDGDSPPLSTALKEQLGLVLTRQKVPISSLVVDKVDLPTEN